MRKPARYYYTQRSYLKRVSGPLFCVLAIFYLGFHSISGERGLLALLKETRHLEVLTAELAEVKAERESLDKKVRGLSNSSLDLDMLDEQARLILGLTGKNELVYFLK